MILLGDPDYYGSAGSTGCVLRAEQPVRRDGGRLPRSSPEEDFQIAVLDPVQAEALAGNVRWHAAFASRVQGPARRDRL